MNLRELGLNLIPCRDNSKIPAIEWKQYQTNTYNGNLSNNNAVICGITSGNLVVIDLDDPTLAEMIFKDFEGVKKKTLVVATGKKGYHIYIRNTGVMPRTMRLSLDDGRHIDIQSQGAYVIAPDSIHPDTGRKYEIISSTTEIMTSSIDGLLSQLSGLGFKGINSGLPTVTEIVQGIQEGNRNNAAFKYCAFLIGNLNLPNDMVYAEIQRWNSILPKGLPNEEIEAVFKSATQRVQRPTEETVEYIPEKLYKLRDLGTKFEGLELNFGAMIAKIGDQTSVTTKGVALCGKCKAEYEVTSDGYVNPKNPKCTVCNVKTDLVRIIETIDMKEIYLQELQEYANHNNPIIFKARVIGENINKIGTAQRKRFNATFKSFTTDKIHNDVALLVNTVEDLEESVEITLSQDKIEELKEKFKDPEFEKKLINSFAPHIQGHHRIKESIIYLAIGGSKELTKRSRIHIAIVGNKSKGKSELLDELTKITGGTYLVGISTTKAGLGTGMVKLSDGTSISKAGPLVVYSGKTVSLDELDKMGDEDKKALYECMEQGTVTSAKANIGGEERLIADTSILAALNFQYGDWDKLLSITENINIYPALLSRFALLWRVLDYSEIDNQLIASKILGLSESTQPVLTPREFRLYINTIKHSTPNLSTDARKKIMEFFLRMTEKPMKELPMEIRQLHDLIRLTIARAKMLMKDEADVKDAEHIIELFKDQLRSWGISCDETHQTGLADVERMNKQQLLLHLFKESCEKGTTEPDIVINKWMTTTYFDNRRDAMNELEKWRDTRKVICASDGKYHLSKEYL